jgi:hypothetical protein
MPHHYGSPGNEMLNESTFGHAISRDLETWTEKDTVLSLQPGQWDAHHVWAPCVVEKDGVTWMFYTGVRDSQMSATPTDWIPRWQTIGVAYSTDPRLEQWTHVANPVWQPCAGNGLPGVNWAVCSPVLARGTADFRDPHVQPPPAGSNQPWLLYYTARPRIDQWNYIVGVAQSPTGPGGAWTDVGAVWDLYTPTGNSKLESPHTLEHNGIWHLFTTGDDVSTGILWSTALAPATGPWQAHGPISFMLEGKQDVPFQFTLEPDYWFASEAFIEAGPSTRSDYFNVVHAYDAPALYNPPTGPGDDISIIEFRQMIWHPNGTFDLAAPNPVRAVTVPGPSAQVGQTVNVGLDVEYGNGRTADLEVVRIVGGNEIALDNAAIGLPSTVLLSGNGTINVPWLVRSSTLPLPSLVEVRVANQPLQVAARLTIAASEGSADDLPRDLPISRVLSPEPRNGSAPGRGIDPEPIGFNVRALGSTPLSAGRHLLVEMPDAGRARIELYDVLGRRVRLLGERELPQGATLEGWDAKDDAGRPVARGVYFARVTTAFGRAHARFLVLD